MSAADKLPLYFNKSKGVDRLLRFLQYSSRLIDVLGISKRFLSMSAQLSTARKVLRLGAPLALSLRIIRRIQGEALTVLKCCETVSEICLIFFILSDHLMLVQKIGIYNFKNTDPIEFVNNWSSLIDSIMSLIVSIADILQGKGSFEGWLELWTNILEAPLTFSFLAEDFFSPLVIYSSGAVTAVMGAIQLWITL